MYAVIFKASINEFDEEYFSTAENLRALAFSKYNCKDFTACTEGKEEIAISYWDSLEDIAAWKNDPEHRAAQDIGRKKWYKSHKVEIVTILK